MKNSNIKQYDIYHDKKGLLWSIISDHYGVERVLIKNRKFGCCSETLEDFKNNYIKIEKIKL